MDKKDLIELMTNHWFAEKIFDDVVFYKHVVSKKRSSIYQVVLSGTSYDGVYELNVGDRFNWKIKNTDEINISSLGSLDCALFCAKKGFPMGYKKPRSSRNHDYSVVRMDFDTDENFMKALLDTGLVDEEEYYTYTFKGSQEYIYSKLPKINFVA